MCGNIQFYGKCGFVVATSKGIRYADDPDDDAPYFVDEKDVDEFEKQFPPKEKKVLPEQLG